MSFLSSCALCPCPARFLAAVGACCQLDTQVLVFASIGRIRGWIEVACFAAVFALAPDLQAQHIALDRASQPEFAVAGIAIVVVTLQCHGASHAATPAAGHFLGNDVDDTAHGFGAIQRRHGTPDDLNALNGRQRGEQIGLNTAGATVHGFAGVLALTINQNQGVLSWQTANHDVRSIGVVAHQRNPFHRTHCIGNRFVVAFLDVFLCQHADGRGRVLDTLLHATGGDHNRVHLRSWFLL